MTGQADTYESAKIEDAEGKGKCDSKVPGLAMTPSFSAPMAESRDMTRRAKRGDLQVPK